MLHVPRCEGSSSRTLSTILGSWVAIAVLGGCGTVDVEPISLRGLPSTLGEGLVGYWKLDETTATEPVVDSSGQGVEGTPVNAPLPSPQVAPAKIRNSGSRSFNGVDQFIDLGNPPVLNFGGSITLAAWVKLASMPEGCRVVLGHGFRRAPPAARLG